MEVDSEGRGILIKYVSVENVHGVPELQSPDTSSS